MCERTKAAVIKIIRSHKKQIITWENTVCLCVCKFYSFCLESDASVSFDRKAAGAELYFYGHLFCLHTEISLRSSGRVRLSGRSHLKQNSAVRLPLRDGFERCRSSRCRVRRWAAINPDSEGNPRARRDCAAPPAVTSDDQPADGNDVRGIFVQAN